MTNIDQAFGAVAATYDQVRTALIPDYDDVYGAALSVLVPNLSNGGRILDVGAGTGAFAAELANDCPVCTFVLADISEEMLEQAKSKFEGDDRFSFVQGNVISDPMPGPFDAVISSYVIHHMSDGEKAAIFKRIAGALKPGGLFVSVDQFTTECEVRDEALLHDWLEDCRQAGAGKEDLDAAISRMEQFDQNATIEDQLDWLCDGGFASAETIYRKYFWAVFVARKPSS
ncbi:MAG: class I SAM-dependent methyltransferase [Hyphomicrobiales bacterium]